MRAEVAKGVDPDKVARALAQGIVEKLKQGAIDIGDFDGGVRVKWEEREMSLELTDAALREVLSRFLRKAFRELVFKV